MKTLTQIHQDLISKNKTVRQVVDEAISVIRQHEKSVNPNLLETENINAILGLYSQEFLNEQVEKAQAEIDEKIANGKIDEINILTGVPIIIKDNILVRGESATSASKMLENYVATYDATVIEKLKSAGAIILARANMDEFAMGGSGENSYFGSTKNPIDVSRVPGGSSSGSAAALAYDATAIALGSDTGGSVRLPAAFCNLVGYKPTYGAVSRYGLAAMGSSLDQIGTLAHNVSDAEVLFKAISGFDERDSTSIKEEVKKEIESKNGDGFLKKKIGIPSVMKDEKVLAGIDAGILENFYKSVDKLKAAGYEIVDIDLPHLSAALAVYYVITPAEVSSNMGRYDGVRYGYSSKGENTIENFTKSRTEGMGKEVRRRILMGTYILSAGYYDAYYNKALELREILRSEFKKAFESVDAILTPVSPIAPWKFGEKSDPLTMYLVDIFTITANIIGTPSISVPIKKRDEVSEDNLPESILLTGSHFEDDKLFEIAKDFESMI